MVVARTEPSAVNVEPARRILGLSGGKDSAALAIYLRQRGRDEGIEYFFCDTGAELREVYEYLVRLEGYLERPIARLSSNRDFDHHLKRFNGFLPSVQARWCTRVMKLEPLEAFVGNDPCVSYVAIRADENRQGYVSHKPNITSVYPFIEDGIVRADVFRLLEETVGVPEYYKWRSRSGCYFCFFQRRDEWVGLAERHPALFDRAKQYEGVNPDTGKLFTWVPGATLDEVMEDAEAIKATAAARPRDAGSWQDRLAASDDDEDGCLICML